MAMKPGFHVGLVLMLAMFIITACSGGGDPVTGALPGGDEGLMSPRTATVTSSRALWGYWHIAIDPATSIVEIVPVRGVMMHVNAVEWMQPPAGSVTNLGVTIVDETLFELEGRIDIDVSLTHPFGGLDIYTGFDVMGVYMTDGHRNLDSDLAVTLSDGGYLDSTLRNSDGYTRWWNQLEFNGTTPRIFSYIPGALAMNGKGICEATLNPYKYFAHGIGVEEDAAEYVSANPDIRGYFGAGETITRRYELQWAMDGTVVQFEFDYAVVASWEEAEDDPPAIPEDFPISANAFEPVALSVADNSDLFYDDSDDSYGGNFTADLEVYGWQGLSSNQSIPGTINQIIIEFPDSDALPGGSYTTQNSSTWSVSAGSVHSSVWHVDIAGLVPVAMGMTPVMIIFETIYDYDNGFGTPYPVSKPLSSYFMIETEIYGAQGIPTCVEPVPEFISRNYVEIEGYSVDVSVPGGSDYSIDWSVVLDGDPKDWVTLSQPPPAEDIIVNWYVATGADPGPPTLGVYEVCASVYNPEGYNFCCTTVVVDDLPTLGPVTGQDGLIPNQQPDQGAEPCDITVWNGGTDSAGQLLYQDSGLSQVRMYYFNDDYSSITDVNLLDTSTYPAPLDDPTSWNDYHKFDVTPTGSNLQITSASDTLNSIADPATYIINDPYHAWVMPYWNLTGSSIMIGLYGDAGVGPAAPPDPDLYPWKHVVDWTSGAVSFDARMYGLQTLSEEWLPNHIGEQHPGTIWGIYTEPPYSSMLNDYAAFGMSGMSTQYSVPGDINDIDPGLMAVAIDDAVPVVADFDSTTNEFLSNIVTWFILSSEPVAADRKVHICLLPEEHDNPAVDQLFYDNYIGNGSLWGVDFGGTAVPVDIEVINANDEDFAYSHTYNWLAVLLDTDPGGAVAVYRYDPFFGSLVLVNQYVVFGTGIPTAIDIDTEQHEMHVLYDLGGGAYRITVLEFTL